jgi:competence protein ComEC
MGARISLIALLLFMAFRLVDVWNARQQKKLIVYNIPKHSAIDVMVGQNCLFKADSVLQQNDLLQKFHLQPSRLLHRVINLYPPANSLVEKNFFRFGNTSFLLIDTPLNLEQASQKMTVDIIILLNNPAIKIAQLANVFTCRQYVFDASNPTWKVAKWQQECDQLGLPAFSVAARGAFVFNLY